MGFFWEKPPGGKHANPEQTFRKLDELKANKHTLFDVSLFMPKPLWSLANYCMNFLPDSFAYFSQAQRGASQGMVASCLHPGATMGQPAEKQKAAWQTLFSAISGGGLRLLTE